MANHDPHVRRHTHSPFRVPCLPCMCGSDRRLCLVEQIMNLVFQVMHPFADTVLQHGACAPGLPYGPCSLTLNISNWGRARVPSVYTPPSDASIGGGGATSAGVEVRIEDMFMTCGPSVSCALFNVWCGTIGDHLCLNANSVREVVGQATAEAFFADVVALLEHCPCPATDTGCRPDGTVVAPTVRDFVARGRRCFDQLASPHAGEAVDGGDAAGGKCRGSRTPACDSAGSSRRWWLACAAVCVAMGVGVGVGMLVGRPRR